MNKNREEKSISRRTTPMNLNLGSNEKMRKSHRNICQKGIQKCTAFNRNGMQVRDGPDRMARNPEKQVMNLGQLIRNDPRISTPLNGSTSPIWHNVIKWRWLIIRVHRLLYLRHPKSRGHYQTSNDILFTSYPTLHKLSVGIIGVERKVQVELSNQGSQRRMVYIHQRQPGHTPKISPNF